MKMKAIFVFAAVLMIGVSSSFAEIGWAGLQWPPDGSTHLPTDDITVYVQTWKGGCTDVEPGLTGQCADIDEVWLDFRRASEGTFTSVLMSWNSFHISSNDEYQGTIPSSATSGGENMVCRAQLHDVTDDTWYVVPEWQYVIQEGTSNDVTVHFQVDVSCVNPAWIAGGLYFTGGFLGWGQCNPAGEMVDMGGGIWEGTYLFPAGSTTHHEYKFQRNDGVNCNWSPGGNFSFDLDDSNPDQFLDVQIYPCENPWGPAEITGPGSYCIYLCCCDNELWIPLNTPYDPPQIFGLTLFPGCNLEDTNCDDPDCSPGQGAGNWNIVQGDDGNWYFTICLIDIVGGPQAYEGCFCLTIDDIFPVELSSFDAIAGDGEVTLNWSTASETDNDYFRILRDNAEVGQVNAHNSATGSDYVWVDRDVTNGVTYEYILVNVDIDGSEQNMATRSATPNRNNANVMEYRLDQNFPNPFNPSTSISYSLEATGLVTIMVFDVTGREVATLVNSVQAEGSHSVEFNAAGLPSGIYMYRMEAGDFSDVQKMVLMK